MPWAAGSFSRLNGDTGWVDDASLGIGIEAGEHDLVDTDFKNGINQCLNKDGSNSCTGDLNLGGFKPVNVAAGTAAAPAICAGGDVNTGIFSPAADQIGIATNGTERIRINASGNVGIGETSPVEPLVIKTGASATAGVSFRGNNATTANEFWVGQGSDGLRGFIYVRGNSDLVFGTNNTERMRIADAGFIGIGNNGPAVLLDLTRNANDTLTRIRIANQTDQSSVSTRIDIGNNANASAVSMFLNATSNTSNGGANAFHIFQGLAAPIRMRAGGSGGVDLASGATSWAAVSDSRKKKNIQPLSYGLTEVVSLNPIRFDYNDDESDDSKRLGFIAQDVKPIIPEAVNGSDDTFYTLSATELIPALVNAVKELSTKVEALEARVAELEA